jgi:pimeloyl-ACP methyl ester carboxylesterase
VVAHGGAAPVIVAAALRSPPRGVVVSNGPVRHVDPVTRALGRALTAGALPLHPVVWLPFLRSSAALRRVVNNPYVMDRDTVAALCGGAVADAGRRGRMRTWIRALSGPLPDPRALRCPVGIVWGDADRLNPAMEADWFESAVPGSVRVDVAGGRFAHPVERPWAFADAVTRIADVWAQAGRPGHQSHA